jgi:hypothetical protein
MRENCEALRYFIFTFLSTLLVGFAPLYGQTNIANYLSGTWKNVAFNHSETWKQERNMLKGFGLALEGNDTLFYERLEINLAANPMVYTSWVNGQNDGDSIEFKLSEATDTSWLFENPQHDFPKKIHYIRTGAATMEAYVSGHEKGIARKERFYFVRKAN